MGIQNNLPLKSLNSLARLRRDYLSNLIIGITGSCGKTTVKEMLYFFLSQFAYSYKSVRGAHVAPSIISCIRSSPTPSTYTWYSIDSEGTGS